MTDTYDKKPLARLLNVVLIIALLTVSGLPESLVGDNSSAESIRILYILFNLSRIVLALFSLTLIFLQRKQYQKEFSAYGARLFSREATISDKARNLPAMILDTIVIVLLITSAVSILISAFEFADLYQNQFLLVLAQYFYSMGRIIGGWVLWFFTFMGIGLLFRRIFCLVTNCGRHLLFAFWIGWGVTIVFLQCWHLFFKIGIWPFTLVLIAGVGGLFLEAKNTKQILARPGQYKKYFVILLIILVFWMSNASNFPPKNYDAGLYDFQMIKWAKSYPIVPGLGNLNIRFSYHNASHLYVALLDQGPWELFSHRLANNLLIMALLIQILIGFFAVGKRQSKRSVYNIFLALTAPAVIYWASSKYVTSPNPDALLYPLGVVIVAALIDLIRRKKDPLHGNNQRLLFIVFLSAVGIAIKMSFFALGVCSSVIAFGWWLFYRDSNAGKSVRTVTLCSVAVVVALVPWMIRGVILSGYIALPSSVGSFDTEWTVPKNIAARDSAVVRGWARDPTRKAEIVMADWSWIYPWSKSTFSRTFDIVTPILCTIAGALIWIISLFRKRKTKAAGGLFLVLIPPVASIAFWFFTAPGPQFEGAAFWILAAVAFTGAVVMLDRNSAIIFQNVALGIVVLLSIIFFLALPVTKGLLLSEDNIPQPEIVHLETDSGLVLNVPKEELCWDAPLPCTPTPNKHIKARNPDDLGAGFVFNR